MDTRFLDTRFLDLFADPQTRPAVIGLYTLLVGLLGLMVGFIAAYFAQEAAARRRGREARELQGWRRRQDLFDEALSRLKQWNYYSLYDPKMQPGELARLHDRLFHVYDRLLEIEPLLAPYPAISAKYKEVVALCLDAGLRAREYSPGEREDIAGSVDVMILELATLMRKETRQARR
ncbi:MAG: hypothetical protein M3498_00530 [Deinococcota bacterium]|jgi:hypothetical protein|nr:hypothetical protein [Deinococcota bacterium]